MDKEEYYKNIKHDIKKLISSLDGNINDWNKLALQVLKDSYNYIRMYNEDAEKICILSDEVVYAVFNSKEELHHHIWNRITSFISLKNDVRLQLNLDKEILDLYYKENSFLVYKGHYLKGQGTIYKIIENIAKIQFAYNLLECDVCLIDMYNILFKEFFSDPKQLAYYTNDKEIKWEYNNVSMIIRYKMLFNSIHYGKDPLTIFDENMMLHSILLTWNKWKLLHKYGKDLNDAKYDIDKKKYNFVF